MSTFNIKGGDFRHSVFGDNATQINNPQRAEETEKLLATLTAQIEALSKELPPQKAEQVRSDLETLTREAKSPEPRKSMFTVTGEGLVDAAKTVATMAPSITATVMELSKLLFP
jgi:hypothetical protein